MKYSEVGFRETYRKFCLFEMNDTIHNALRRFPGANKANSVLSYGYIDHEDGMKMEVLCACKKDGEGISLAPGTDEVSCNISIHAIEDVEFEHIDRRIGARFSKKMESVSRYEPSENEGLRNRYDLDFLRDKHNPDDVMVILRRKGEEKGEGVWVRLEGITEMFIIGELLNEPYDDFGYQKGDMVCIREVEVDGETALFLDERLV